MAEPRPVCHREGRKEVMVQEYNQLEMQPPPGGFRGGKEVRTQLDLMERTRSVQH